MTLAEIIATPDRFKAWVDRHTWGQTLGECGNTARCPLAAWLADEGVVNVSVGGLDIEGEWNGMWFQEPLPQWMKTLVRCVDAKGLGMSVRTHEVAGMLRRTAA